MEPLLAVLAMGLLALSMADVPSTLDSSTVTAIQRKLRTVVRGTSIPTALRLSFHDCVGGCNGCLNVDNADNGGLSDIVEGLEEIYAENDYSSVLSRADFWALAGIYAVDKTIEATNEACGGEASCTVPESGLVFQYGRQDCSTAPYTDDDVGLPAATMAYDDLMDYFDTEFGFDVNETVALMGAHTIGGASEENSGYHGTWIKRDGSNEFNNDFYKKLTDSSLTWRHRDNTKTEDTRHWQWDAKDVAFMLNVDVALYKDIQVDDDGESSCGYDSTPSTSSTCDSSPTATAVEAFADSNDVWVPAFAAVYTKMLAHGTTELYDLSE